MSRHVDEIRELLFDEPEFESDEEVKKKKKKKVKNDQKKSAVETIVFRDPAKKRKVTKKVESSATPKSPVEEFDLEKARFDVHKFGIKGFEKSKYDNARIALAVGLGAKPPRKKFINYRELKEQNRAKKDKDKEDEENARLLGDLFQKNPNNKMKSFERSKQKRLGQGDVGAMRFSSVGKFQGGVLKLTDRDISKVKNKSKSSSNKRR